MGTVGRAEPSLKHASAYHRQIVGCPSFPRVPARRNPRPGRGGQASARHRTQEGRMLDLKMGGRAALGDASPCSGQPLPCRGSATGREPANLASVPGSGCGNSAHRQSTAARACSPDGLKHCVYVQSYRQFRHLCRFAMRARRIGIRRSGPRAGARQYSSANDACPTIAQGQPPVLFEAIAMTRPYDLYVARHIAGAWSVEHDSDPNINRPGWLDESADSLRSRRPRSHALLAPSPGRQRGRKSTRASTAGRPASSRAGRTARRRTIGRASRTTARRSSTISDRYGTLGGPDLYYATRSGTSEPFGSADSPRVAKLGRVRRAAVHQLGRYDADLLVGKGGQSVAGSGHLVLNARKPTRRLMNPRLVNGHHPWTEPLSLFFARPAKRGKNKLMSIRKMIALHPDVPGHVNQPLGDAVHHLMYCAKMCLSCADACAAEKMDMAPVHPLVPRLRRHLRGGGQARGCAGPARTSRCSARCSSCAPGSATHARPSARSTSTSIASCARRCAGNAPRTAATRRRRSNNRHSRESRQSVGGAPRLREDNEEGAMRPLAAALSATWRAS